MDGKKKGKLERKTAELTNILLTFQHKFEIYHIYEIYMRA